MKARDIFGLVVRVIGMFALLFSLWYLAFAIAFSSGLLHDTTQDTATAAYYTFGIPAFIVGIVLLRFGRQIVRFSYPKDKDDADA